MRILVLNTGSSSHKCILFDMDTRKAVWKAHVEWEENVNKARMKIQNNEKTVEQKLSTNSNLEALDAALKTLPKLSFSAIGHRVVHGAETFFQLTKITDEVKAKIKEISYLAPLHNPANLEGITKAQAMFPNLVNFAVFDTAFHHTMPKEKYAYPLPFAFLKKGIRKYGFHGISHSYCSKRVKELNPEKKLSHIIVCHIGSGISITAVKEGKSFDTTMGMTPLEGVMMATRSGSVDPGIILYLQERENFSTGQIDKILNYESGLLGISNISSDLRVVEKSAENGEKTAMLALDMFYSSLQKKLAEMLISVGGEADAIVFTAGIGENSPSVRKKMLKPFSSWGIELDDVKNKTASQDDREISKKDAKTKVFVIPTKEEWEIAEQIADFFKNRNT